MMPFELADTSVDINGNSVAQTPPEQNPAAQLAPATASSMTVTPDTTSTMNKVFTYGLQGMGVGFVDTVLKSVGLADDDTVTNALKNVFPATGGFADTYAANRSAYRATGEIAGLFLPGMAGLKVLNGVRYVREIGLLGSYLKNSTAADAILGSSVALAKSEAAISAAAAATKTEMGLFSGRTFANPVMDAAKRSYYSGRIMESVRSTAAMEVGYRAFYNQSELFYPADATVTDQVMWGGIGLAAGVGLDFAVGRFAVRSLIKAAEATAGSYSTTEIAKDAANIISRPGDRGTAVTLVSRESQLANEAINASPNPVLKTNAKQDLSVLGNIQTKQIQEMAGDAHPLGADVLPVTKMSQEQITLMQTQLAKNEHTLLFASAVRQLPETGVAGFYLDIKKSISDATTEVEKAQTLLDLNIAKPGKFQAAFDTAVTKLDKLKAASDEVHLVLDNTGDLSVYANRADNVLDTYSFADFKRTTFQENLSTVRGKPDNVTRSRLVDPLDRNVTLSDAFVATGPTPSPKNWSSLYAMATKIIKDWKPAERQLFQLNEKTDRFQAEAIVNLAKTHPDAAALVNFGDNITSLKDAEFQIIDQKYQGFIKDMENTERQPLGIPKILEKAGKLSPEEVIAKWNLPVSDHIAPAPLLQVFAQARLQNAKTLSALFVDKSKLGAAAEHPMDLLQAAMRESVGIADQNVILPTAGKLFQQTDVRPIFIATRSIPQLGHADATIHAMVENRLALTLARLSEIDPNVAPLVAKSIQSIGRTAALPIAKDVISLHEGVVSGRGIVTGQDRIAEQLATLKAVALITQVHEREVLTHVGQVFDIGITPHVSALLSKEGQRTHLVDFGRIEQSYRHGFDISHIEQQADSSARFVLNKDSAQNAKLLKEHFGDTLDRSEDAVNYMPDMSITARKTGNTPLQVSSISAQAAKAIADVSRQTGIEHNALRVAQGKSAIQLRDFHLPSPDLANPDAWFVRNSAQQVTGIYSSGTAVANRQAAMDAAERLQKVGSEPHIAVGYQDVRRAHLFDPDWQNFIDYSDPIAATGKGISGSAAKATIDTSTNTLKNMVRAAADNYINVGTRSRAALFEPQLNYAKHASSVTGKSAFNESNIFDRYTATVFGRSTQSSEGSTGKVYGAIENVFDNAISYAYSVAGAATAQSAPALEGSKILRAIVRSRTSEEEYAQYTKKLGEWSPFQSTQDWLESVHPEVAKHTTKSFAGQLSKISSTLSLRLLDVGTAVLNLAGVMTTAHAVTMGMRQLKGETFENAVQRTAAYGTKLSPNSPITFSSNRAIASTIHAYWSGELSGPLERAAKAGMFPTEYSQLEKALVSPIKGDKNWFDKFVHYGSLLADNSEILSRQMAWSLGYKLGMDVHKFDDEKNAFIYAANFVDEMIGNYSPKNKPGMFQGAIGSPVGAMQTYMFNYYRRSYGYIERKDYRTIAAAYATQASVFGAGSVPGWGAFSSTLFSNYDGSDNIITRLDRTYSPGVAELLLHGTLSSIPGIFGRDDWNMNFYSRGSTDITQVPATPVDYARAAPIQFLTNTGLMIGATIDNFMTEGGFSVQQQEELMANFSTNRALKNILEFAAGAKTDRGGQVVAAATLDALHIAAFLLGTVPASTKNAQDTYNAQQLVEKHQEALRTSLNDKTRALFRSGNFDIDDLQNLVAGYTRSGGNPGYFGQWLRNNVEASFIPKADRKLKELSTSGRWLEFVNMLASLQQNQGPSSSTPVSTQ